MRNSANYKVIENTDTYLLLDDLGPHDHYKTITNAPETVIRGLKNLGFLTPGKRVFYYDSEGVITELKFDHAGEFTGFGPGVGSLKAQFDAAKEKGLDPL